VAVSWRLQKLLPGGGFVGKPTKSRVADRRKIKGTQGKPLKEIRRPRIARKQRQVTGVNDAIHVVKGVQMLPLGCK